MNRKIFLSLFKHFLIEVAGLYPQRKRIGGFKIYSTKEKDFCIPVIVTNAEMLAWLNFLKPEIGEWAKNAIDGRLALISSSMIEIEDVGETNISFQYQLVFNPSAFSGFVKNAKDVIWDLGIKEKEEIFLEAWTVAYLCHEFRHLKQVLLLNESVLMTSFQKLPKLTNEIISNRRLKKLWCHWTMDQMEGYKKHYSGQRFEKKILKMEKDALIIELLAFDCWLDQKLSIEEKMKKLQEILHIEKR